MKTYKQDASEIMARGKAARRKKQTARRTVLGTVAGVLIFAVVFGAWKQGYLTKQRTRTPTDGSGSVTAAPAESGTSAPEDVTEPPTESYTGAPPSAAESPAAQPGETAVVPRWEEAPCYMQYPTLSFANIKYSTTGVPISPALAGETLGEAASSGYDTYSDVMHTRTVPVARIGSISPQCAVCAVLEDGSTYAYVNADYVPATLGQFIADLDLKNTLVFGEAYAEERAADGNVTFMKFADCDDEILWNGLLADGSLPNEPGRAYGIRRVGFRADVPALGYENRSLSVTEDGCIVINLLETAKVFYIGTAAADSFIAQIQNAVPCETQVNTTFAPEEGVQE